jgi:osmotically-inducible protein OsmY
MLTTTILTYDQIAVLNTLNSEPDADEELARRVFLYLSTRQVGDLRRLSVTARQGRVELQGELNSFYHRQLAIFYARKVAGVVAVEDKITVSLPRKPPLNVARKAWIGGAR